MRAVAWRGESPRGLLQQTLKANGWEPAREGDVAVERTDGVEPPSGAVGTPWVWLTSAPVTAAMAQRAVERGALDVVSTRRAGWETRLVARLEEAVVPAPALTPPPGFVAQSPAAKELLRQIHLAAQTSMPVLLTGETGTGKELAARLIHQWSARKSRAFVPINCAAIPNELMEGELFGYVKGAFTGAARDYAGQLSAAEGGTVFLDEIDDTPHPLQTKLLRVLEDRVISRLGENVWQKVDFRIIAATNRDLRKLIETGHFGDDLYERLATVQLVLPPLRERPEDLEPMTLQLIERYYAEDPGAAKRHRVREVTPEALEVLQGYAWPGNVRELRNVIFGALVTRRAGSALLVSDLPRRLWAKPSRDEGLFSGAALEQRLASGDFNLKHEIEALERAALTAALRRARGNAAEAARLLGEVGRGSAKDPGGTVRTMMKRLGLSRT
ncbi:MAG: sigma-54 dependent transcriptional regulator [Myxococcota bacterium]